MQIGVSLVGDFNQWDHDKNPMRKMGYSGVWELFIAGLKEGQRYKFAIHTGRKTGSIKSRSLWISR